MQRLPLDQLAAELEGKDSPPHLQAVLVPDAATIAAAARDLLAL